MSNERYENGIKQLAELVAYYSMTNPDDYSAIDDVCIRLMYCLGLLDESKAASERVKINAIIDAYCANADRKIERA